MTKFNFRTLASIILIDYSSLVVPQLVKKSSKPLNIMSH